MSTIAAFEIQRPCFSLKKPATQTGSRRWSLVAMAFIVGLVFFVAEHDFFVSRAVAYTQTAEEMQTAAVGGNVMRRIAFFVFAGWGLALCFVSKQRVTIDWPLAGSLFALTALATASVLWSEEPAMCIRRLSVLLCCGFAAAGMAKVFSLREMSWLIVFIAGSFAAIGVVAEILLGTFQPWASDYRFAGTVHPNTQGPALAALCLAVVALVKDGDKYRPLLWTVFVVAAMLLLLTKSRTAVAALMAAIAAVQVVKLPVRAQVMGAILAVWLLSAALGAIWICGYDPVTDFRGLFLLGRAEESESLSGRAFLWPEVIQFAQERFWLGYGYESFWTPARIEAISDSLGWGLREAHNGYLEMWLGLGVTGVALMLLAAVAAIGAVRRGLRMTDDSAYLLPLGLLVFGLFDSCLESGFVVITLAPFLLSCCLMRLALFREQIPFPAGAKAGSGVPRMGTAITISGSTFAAG